MNWHRKRRQCFAQDATRDSKNLEFKLTRAGSLNTDPSIVGCIFQHKIHGNTPLVHESVDSDSTLLASPATSVHSL